MKRDMMITSGKEEFERIAKQVNFTIKLNDKIVADHCSKLNIVTLDDFYC